MDVEKDISYIVMEGLVSVCNHEFSVVAIILFKYIKLCKALLKFSM